MLKKKYNKEEILDMYDELAIECMASLENKYKQAGEEKEKEIGIKMQPMQVTMFTLHNMATLSEMRAKLEEKLEGE